MHTSLHMYVACTRLCVGTLLKKGCYGNTFRGARRTVLLWHPKGVTIGVIIHPKGVLFGVNILPCGVHKHSASVH